MSTPVATASEICAIGNVLQIVGVVGDDGSGEEGSRDAYVSGGHHEGVLFRNFKSLSGSVNSEALQHISLGGSNGECDYITLSSLGSRYFHGTVLCCAHGDGEHFGSHIFGNGPGGHVAGTLVGKA